MRLTSGQTPLLFYSRRIGLDNGQLIPIQAGARLTGKANGVNVGFLDMQTERVDGNTANNFAAVRVSKDLQNRSSIGAIAVNRMATGDQAGDVGRAATADHGSYQGSSAPPPRR